MKAIGSKYLNLNGRGGVHYLGGQVHKEFLTVHKREGALGRGQHCSLVEETVWEGFHHDLRVLRCPLFSSPFSAELWSQRLLRESCHHGSPGLGFLFLQPQAQY